MDDQAFLDAILAAPEDDAPRLVYADWLDEHGHNDRAEFIRLQCDLARRPKYDPGRPALEARERELLIRHEAEWAKPVAALGRDCRFRRGFVDFISIGVRKFLTDGDELFAAAPVRTFKLLRLGTKNATAADFVTNRHLPRVRGLVLSGRLPPGELTTLITAPGLKGLTALIVDETVSAAEVDLLIGGCLPKLSTLRLGAEAPVVTTDRFVALTKAKWAGGLTDLDVRYQPINVGGVQALAAATRFKHLGRLRLHDCGVGLAGTKAIADSPNLLALATLDLRGNRLTDSAVDAIASAKGLKALTELHLGTNKLGPGGARALANWPGLANLRLLNLYSNPLGDDGVRALTESPYAGNLRYLDVNQTGLTSRGQKALEEWAGLRSVSVSFLPGGWHRDDGW
jgi:uncharacterized protein (TIGR02996 family)